MTRLSRRAFGAVLLPLGLSACGLMRSHVPIRSIAFRAAENANGNSPIPLDLVLISDDAVTAPVVALNAADWFQRREQFLRDFPGKLRIMSFELVPGSTVAARPVDRSPRPVAAVVFANYQVPGAHRLRLSDQTDLIVALGEREISIVRP